MNKTVTYKVDLNNPPVFSAHISFDEIEQCDAKVSNKYNQIYWNIFNEKISVDEIATHLKTGKCLGKNSDDSLFKNLLSLYDYLKYGGTIDSLIS